VFPIQFSNSSRDAFAISRRITPEVFQNSSPSKNRGSRECRVHAAPAVSCAKVCIKNAHEHTGTVGTLRHSLRNGFTAYAALSPATNSSCHRRCRPDGWSIRLDRFRHRQLDTNNGCQDHTVLPYAARLTPRTSTSQVLPAKILVKAFKRRSSAQRIRSRETRPANTSR